MPTAPPRQRPQKWRPPRDWGRFFALVLCALFAADYVRIEQDLIAR